MPRIHPTAVVEPGAQLADDVQVGPHAVIGPQVRIGPGTSVGAHAVVAGETAIGARCRLFSFSAIGLEPQDMKFHGERSRLEIGDDCVIREYVTIHPGTAKQDGITVVGSRNWLLVGVHVAHDCVLGDDIIMSNYSVLGGHVRVGSGAVFSAYAGVHQFCRIGRLVMMGAGTIAVQDVPPFVLANGDRARLLGLNRIGLKRAGIAEPSRRALQEAYRIIFRMEGPLAERLDRARALGDPHAVELADFVSSAKRGVCRHGRKAEGDEIAG